MTRTWSRPTLAFPSPSSDLRARRELKLLGCISTRDGWHVKVFPLVLWRNTSLQMAVALALPSDSLMFPYVFFLESLTSIDPLAQLIFFWFWASLLSWWCNYFSDQASPLFSNSLRNGVQDSWCHVIASVVFRTDDSIPWRRASKVYHANGQLLRTMAGMPTKHTVVVRSPYSQNITIRTLQRLVFRCYCEKERGCPQYATVVVAPGPCSWACVSCILQTRRLLFLHGCMHTLSPPWW